VHSAIALLSSSGGGVHSAIASLSIPSGGGVHSLGDRATIVPFPAS
jgi:hypothetical protein